MSSVFSANDLSSGEAVHILECTRLEGGHVADDGCAVKGSGQIGPCSAQIHVHPRLRQNDVTIRVDQQAENS